VELAHTDSGLACLDRVDTDLGDRLPAAGTGSQEELLGIGCIGLGFAADSNRSDFAGHAGSLLAREAHRADTGFVRHSSRPLLPVAVAVAAVADIRVVDIDFANSPESGNLAEAQVIRIDSDIDCIDCTGYYMDRTFWRCCENVVR